MAPTLPPRGFYRADVAPLLADISDAAFRHWHWLRALTWCAPLAYSNLTEADRAIGQLRNISARVARGYRRDLESAGLLASTASSDSISLVPLMPRSTPDLDPHATARAVDWQESVNFGRNPSPPLVVVDPEKEKNYYCFSSNNDQRPDTDKDTVEGRGGVGGWRGSVNFGSNPSPAVVENSSAGVDNAAAALLPLGFLPSVAVDIARRLAPEGLAPEQLAAIGQRAIADAERAEADSPIGMAAHRLLQQHPAALRRLLTPQPASRQERAAAHFRELLDMGGAA